MEGKSKGMKPSIRRKAGKAVLLLLIGPGLMAGAMLRSVPATYAQARDETITIVVPPTLEGAPSAETPLAIQIAPEAAAPRRAMVLIRGLPSNVALSGGRLFESGIWSVSPADLGKLKLTAAAGSAGQSELSISVVTWDGTVLAQARSSLVIAEVSAPRPSSIDSGGNALLTAATPPRTEEPKPAAVLEPTPKPTLAPALAPDIRNRLLGLVRKGDEDLRTGNVINARLLYRHAAENGLAEGALALAATFDETELSRLPVRGGVQADAAEAKRWYERARELGSPQAQQRLQRLGAR